MRSKFEGQNWMRKNSWLDGEIGFGSYIGPNSTIEGKVGRYCSIGANVTVLTGNHPTNTFVSTSPCFYSTAKQNGISYVTEDKFKEKKYVDEENKFGVIIGNDVWIGYGATIVGGITIGDGAIIGANSFVNSNVEAYSIVVGAPARKINMRFKEDEIEFLKELKWWNKPFNWIEANSKYFSDIEVLIKKLTKEG